MTGGLWFLNEDGTDCDELNYWMPPVGLDYTEDELDRLMDEAMRPAPGTKPTPVQRDYDGTII